MNVLNHAFWGRLLQRADADWEFSQTHNWPEFGSIEVRFYVSDPDSAIQFENYRLIKGW